MYQIKGLAKNKQFREVYARGRSVAEKLLVLYFMPNGQQFTRFGFCVGKKIGKAVYRNRVKRILREICRVNSRLIKEGLDCIIIARPRIIGETYHGIEKSFLKLTEKAKLVRKEMTVSEDSNNSSN